MSGKRYPEEFKIEAVKQITEYGHSIPDVAKRLGITPKSLSDWKAQYEDRFGQYPKGKASDEEIRRLKAQVDLSYVICANNKANLLTHP